MGRLLQQKSCRNGSRIRGHRAAFTLAELLVSVGVLVMLVLLGTQLLNSAATITTLGHKQMDADSQARQLLDRMAVDFGQMVKRSDVSYFLKSAAGEATDCTLCGPQPGNDEVRFYSSVPGYYSASPAPTSTQRSPISLVAYRVNSTTTSSSYLKMERLGKGLAWNGASGWIPIWFLPQTILQAYLSTNVSDYEVIGPQVFRFEYYYLLKGQTNPITGDTYTPIFSDTPWDTRICSCPTPNPTPTPSPTPTPGGTPTPAPTPPSLCCHTAVQGMQDVAAVVVDIAVIGPKSKVLLTDAQIAKFSTSGDSRHFLGDYTPGMTPGQLRTQWQNKLNGIIDPNSPDFDSSMPRPAISGIRVYERYLYLSPPTLLTP